MKAGLKLWSTNLDTYSREAEKLYNEGVYDYIELYVVPETIDSLAGWKKLNLPFTIHCPHSAHGFNLAKPDLQQKNLEIFNQVRLFADELKADYIVIHGGLDGNAYETAKQMKSLNDSRALIENKPFKSVPGVVKDKTCIGYNKEELEIIINESGCGLCLDFGHGICSANSLLKEPFAYIKDLISLKPKMFHLTDVDDFKSEIDSHLHLGKGQLDFTKITEFLTDDSKVTLETVKNSKTSLEDFVEDVKFFRSLKKKTREGC